MKTHHAKLQLDVRNHVPIVSSTIDETEAGRRFSLLFPVLAEQSKPKGCLTLHELEFENLDNLDAVPNEKTPESLITTPSSEPSSSLLQ